MATSRTRKRPALERVLETADRLFYGCGVRATGVDLIAAEANVSKATLYTYFPTKDELVAEYLRRRSRQWQEHVSRELGRRGGPARGRILLVFDLLQDWFLTPEFRGCPFLNSEAECGPQVPAHEVNLQHRAWVHGLFTELLAEAGVRRAEPVARQLELLYDGAMCSAQADPGVDWIAAAKRTVGAVLDAERHAERK
jgi:AcrR family transcriptional regulator